uniref:NADH-ubiquinone oxidoreductase chain 2 n=1 Tax=Pallaseopsis kessleri TaxID=686709 RepID=A0A1L5BW66_9CRUS|nr:NADH dehydrogenase subunit 2 [Pallaseopsis kessleri]APL97208.1 NADH dehydrogenase subunit 2 [Pallaseopsis kessleri]
MLLHPATYLFYLTLATSVLITVSANSWFIAWVGLEINMLVFIPLALSKKNKYSVESSLKYFLVQSLASIFIILASTFMTSSSLPLLTMAMLILKTGTPPFHQWLPAMVDGLSWPIFTLLMTAQKLSPLTLIFFLMKPDLLYLFITLCVLISSLIGALGGLSQTSLRKILTYSSISHMAWTLQTLKMDSSLWLVYFTLYAFVLSTLTSILASSQMSVLVNLSGANKSYISLILALSVLSLAGLPPFTGFLPKLLATQLMLQTSENYMMIPLLLSAYVTLFFYARVLLTALILNASSSTTLNKEKKSSSVMLSFSLVGLLVPSLSIMLL